MICISYKYKQGVLCLNKNIAQKYNFYLVSVYQSKFCDLSLCFTAAAAVSTTFQFFQFFATYSCPSPSTLTGLSSNRPHHYDRLFKTILPPRDCCRQPSQARIMADLQTITITCIVLSGVASAHWFQIWS